MQGHRPCIDLLFSDGRSLVCTPDHEIYTTEGIYCRADELIAGKSKVMLGLEGARYNADDDEEKHLKKFHLQLNEMVHYRVFFFFFSSLLSHLALVSIRNV